MLMLILTLLIVHRMCNLDGVLCGVGMCCNAMLALRTIGSFRMCTDVMEEWNGRVM